MSSPELPFPRFFLDRSLGRKAVPGALRCDGWNLITLAEHYGVPADEQVADVDWIEEASRQGWPILMKDKRIRHRHAEREAVVAHKARCFVITRGDLSSAEMVSRFIGNKAAILAAVAQPGPYIYSVQTDRISRLYPPLRQERKGALERMAQEGQAAGLYEATSGIPPRTRLAPKVIQHRADARRTRARPRGREPAILWRYAHGAHGLT